MRSILFSGTCPVRVVVCFIHPSILISSLSCHQVYFAPNLGSVFIFVRMFISVRFVLWGIVIEQILGASTDFYGGTMWWSSPTDESVSHMPCSEHFDLLIVVEFDIVVYEIWVVQSSNM